MKIFEALLDIVLLPIEILKDIGTLGGELEGKRKSYTREKLEEIDEELFE